MQVTVHYNKLPIAPRKLRAVVYALRHRTVAEAIALMSASPRVTTEPITKLLKASISAARDRNPAVRPADLRVAEIFANEAARLYRTRMKSRGRASRFAKRGSHLTLTVEWTEQKAAAPVRKAKVTAKTAASTSKTEAKPADAKPAAKQPAKKK